MPSKKNNLPKKLLIFNNQDKNWKEKWTPNRDLLDIPKSFRLICSGRPNSGKSLIAINIMLRCNFEKIYVLHCDEDSKDYANIEYEALEEVPDKDIFDDDLKKLLIIDDYEFKNMKKEDLKKLSTLFRYVSSHKNLSIIVNVQNFYDVPIICRRCANFFILFENNDKSYIQSIARKCMIPQNKLLYIMENYIKNFHDSIWIDLTLNTPAKIRLNGYDIIDQ